MCDCKVTSDLRDRAALSLDDLPDQAPQWMLWHLIWWAQWEYLWWWEFRADYGRRDERWDWVMSLPESWSHMRMTLPLLVMRVASLAASGKAHDPRHIPVCGQYGCCAQYRHKCIIQACEWIDRQLPNGYGKRGVA